MSKHDLFYKAMSSKDHRFDGKFFVGVKTTGIYCRPICPANLPRRQNVEFFGNSLEAEKAGYRPCKRCRPESAPQSPAWIGKSAIVQRAIKVLHSSESLEFNESSFAAHFGVSSRHLRRLFVKEIGKTPKQISFENRLNLSRKLIVETSLPISEIVFASGFTSIRRFNDAFKDRFKKAPSEFRRAKVKAFQGLRVSIPYRPPFDFAGLMKFYETHRMGGLEWFEHNKMHRVISFNNKVGQIEIYNSPEKSELIVEIDFPDTTAIHCIIAKVKAMFDLNSDPLIIANSLESEPTIKKIFKKYPGIRLPSGWDSFEISIAAILGQFVSLDQGRSLVGDLIEIAGSDSGLFHKDKSIKLFPTPRQIIEANLSALKTTGARKQTLVEFSKSILNKSISLAPTQDVESFIVSAMKLRGIGPWTAHYMALKALRSADAFPTSDLILGRMLKKHAKLNLKQMSPWRGYVAALFWRNHSDSLKKGSKK